MPGGYRGGEGKLYYASDWTDGNNIPASPTWVEVKRAVDVSFAGSKGEADLSSRAGSWKKRTGGLKDAGVTFGYRLKQGADTVYNVLLDSWLNDTPVLFAVMDDAIATSGAKGWQMAAVVMNFPEEQGLEAGAIVNVGIAPCDAVDGSGDEINPSHIVTA